MQNENLNDMLKEFDDAQVVTEVVESQEISEIHSESDCGAYVAATDETSVSESEALSNELYTIHPTEKILLISFPDWVEKYYNSSVFSPENGIRCPRTSLNGVDSKENLLFTVPHHDGGTDESGNIKKEVRMMYGTKSMYIPDIAPLSLTIYKNNSACALHMISDNLYIKSYILKAGTILSHCYNKDGVLIPYMKEKIKRKNSGEAIKSIPNIPVLDSVYESELLTKDYETVVLLYRQITKSNETFDTKKKILDWFSDKIKEIYDINHLLKIDLITEFIVSGKLS